MKTANAGENWVYLDGQIAKGSQPHPVLIHEVGKHLTGEPVLGMVANTWLAGNELPKGLNTPGDPNRHGIARGHYDKQGRPAIWESNADRNHVMDAAHAALGPLNGGRQSTAAYGYRESTEEMYAKIQGLGWDVLSQGPKHDLYSVTIKSVDGAQIERTGKTPEQAMASALTWAWQHSHMSGHVKDDMDLPIPTQTLGQVLAMLRPNALDGNHLGLQAHKLGYSIGDLQTVLRLEEAEGVQPGWKSFKEAALSAYASRGWKVEAAGVELRLLSETGSIERIQAANPDEAKQMGYAAMSDSSRDIYRAQIWDSMANRATWDTDKEWRKDKPVEEETPTTQNHTPRFEQLTLGSSDWVVTATDELKPDFTFVYYQGALEVEDYSPNNRPFEMLQRILDMTGKDVTDQNVEDNKMSSGDIYKRDGNIDVELTNLADNDVQTAALDSVHEWARGMNLVGPIQPRSDG